MDIFQKLMDWSGRNQKRYGEDYFECGVHSKEKKAEGFFVVLLINLLGRRDF
jgi:hypothetical protein